MALVNEHQIDLLEGMTVENFGMFEYIAYKGWTIYTQDLPEFDMTKPYQGIFVVDDGSDNMFEFANLGQVKMYIDNHTV